MNPSATSVLLGHLTTPTLPHGTYVIILWDDENNVVDFQSLGSARNIEAATAMATELLTGKGYRIRSNPAIPMGFVGAWDIVDDSDVIDVDEVY